MPEQRYLGRRLSDQALEQGSDPDEARRARGEADFLTSRALKLAPDNDEVKKLSDQVVNLLELKDKLTRNLSALEMLFGRTHRVPRQPEPLVYPRASSTASN